MLAKMKRMKTFDVQRDGTLDLTRFQNFVVIVLEKANLESILIRKKIEKVYNIETCDLVAQFEKRGARLMAISSSLGSLAGSFYAQNTSGGSTSGPASPASGPELHPPGSYLAPTQSAALGPRGTSSSIITANAAMSGAMSMSGVAHIISTEDTESSVDKRGTEGFSIDKRITDVADVETGSFLEAEGGRGTRVPRTTHGANVSVVVNEEESQSQAGIEERTAPNNVVGEGMLLGPTAQPASAGPRIIMEGGGGPPPSSPQWRRKSALFELEEAAGFDFFQQSDELKYLQSELNNMGQQMSSAFAMWSE